MRTIEWSGQEAQECAPSMGEKVKLARRAVGWTQDDLARFAGVSKRTVCNIEAGGDRSSKCLPVILNAVMAALVAGMRTQSSEAA